MGGACLRVRLQGDGNKTPRSFNSQRAPFLPPSKQTIQHNNNNDNDNDIQGAEAAAILEREGVVHFPDPMLDGEAGTPWRWRLAL